MDAKKLLTILSIALAVLALASVAVRYGGVPEKVEINTKGIAEIRPRLESYESDNNLDHAEIRGSIDNLRVEVHGMFGELKRDNVEKTRREEIRDTKLDRILEKL